MIGLIRDFPLIKRHEDYRLCLGEQAAEKQKSDANTS